MKKKKITGTISVFRSSVRSHATHAIGELKKGARVFVKKLGILKL
jgi:hypothetical protein